MCHVDVGLQLHYSWHSRRGMCEGVLSIAKGKCQLVLDIGVDRDSSTAAAQRNNVPRIHKDELG